MKRELPTAIEHEKRLLSKLMLCDGKIVADVAAMLTPADFYRPEHKAIYTAILTVSNRDETVDATLVASELKRTKAPVNREYFFSLIDLEFSTAGWQAYADKIKETARLRAIINTCDVALDKAYDGTSTADQLQGELENMLYSSDKPTEAERAADIAAAVYQRAIELSKSKELTGVTTGLWDLDKVTNGLQNSDLIFLAARPSMGKTALALNIAHNAARRKKSVLVFSMEMSKPQIGARLLSGCSGVAATKITSGRLTDADKCNMIEALDELGDLTLYIDETSSLTVSALASKARRFKRDHGLDLIVVDYVQLMVGRHSENRVQEVSAISRNLKALAKSMNVPILALSQLSRNVEMRADKRPQLSDLRESGSLEQDADVVMFLYRDAQYDPATEHPEVAELLIAKHRNGATATVRLKFQKDIMLFSDLMRTED